MPLMFALLFLVSRRIDLDAGRGTATLLHITGLSLEDRIIKVHKRERYEQRLFIICVKYRSHDVRLLTETYSYDVAQKSSDQALFDVVGHSELWGHGCE
jgi:predicted ATPase